MRGRQIQWAAAVAAGLIGSMAARFAAADGPAVVPVVASTPADQDELRQEVRQLQAKVDRLEAKDAGRPAVVATPTGGPTPADTAGQSSPEFQHRGDTDPIDSFKPAAGPTAVGAGGMSSLSGGWNGDQFTLRSADGNFTFHPGLTADLRDLTSYRERVPAKGGGSEVTKSGYDTQNGFDVSRLRLIFDGTLFHQVSYLLQFSADQGSSLTLLDAAASYKLGTSPFTLKVGQFKDPVWHERNLSEANQIAVDRSLVEQFLAGGAEQPHPGRGDHL